MNRRVLLVALALLAVLAAFAVYTLRQDELDRKAHWERDEHVFPVPRESVESLEVTLRNGMQASFRRVETGWERTGGSPETIAERVPEVLYAWSRARFGRYVDREPEDRARYDLDPPVLRLEARTRNGQRHTLEMGGMCQLTGIMGAYAHLNDGPEVVLVETGHMEVIAETAALFGLQAEERTPGGES